MTRRLHDNADLVGWHRVTFRRSLACLTCTLFILCGCRDEGDKSKEKSPAPAHVENKVTEAGLAKVTLSPEAEVRLGIQTVPVEMRSVKRTRTVGGEVVVPEGRRITVHAPLAGTLLPAPGVPAPMPGSRLQSGQVVFRLSPAFVSDGEVLQPSDRISLARAQADLAAAVAGAEGELAGAQVEVEAAKIKQTRAEQLRQDNVGSLRACQEAEAELRLAESRAEAAARRLQILKDTRLEAEAGAVTALPIESPQEGQLDAMHVVSGEAVAAGAPLFGVSAIDPVWVRVAVYVGDRDRIDLDAAAAITDLAFQADTPVRLAHPAVSPPSADASAATIDLFYELGNSDAALLRGTKVGVRLTLKASEENLVIPWSAVLFDINGGAWVYENVEPHVFAHRRVEVRYVIDGMAVLSRGPAAGTPIVTAGAAELFGTEFGGGK